MEEVAQEYTDRFSSGFKRTAEGLIECARVAAEVRAKYGYTKYIQWLSDNWGLKARMGHNLLAVNKNLLMANFAVEAQWKNFAVSALYLMASPSTPEEAVDEAVELANSGQIVTHAIAQNIIVRAIRVVGELNEAPDDIVRFVGEKGIDDPEFISDLKSLKNSEGKPGSNNTFSEIISTGGFHYGDDMEEWCDVSTATARERYEALRSISRQHIKQSVNTREEAIEELIEAAKGLSSYRHRAGSLNFQLEKADDYIYAMRDALAKLGVSLV